MAVYAHNHLHYMGTLSVIVIEIKIKIKIKILTLRVTPTSPYAQGRARAGRRGLIAAEPAQQGNRHAMVTSSSWDAATGPLR